MTCVKVVLVVINFSFPFEINLFSVLFMRLIFRDLILFLNWLKEIGLYILKNLENDVRITEIAFYSLKSLV